MTYNSPEHDDRIWSEVRQEYMSKFDERLYLERAGLAPEEAVIWWERYILSAEAADAIAAGRTLAEEVELLPERRRTQRTELQQREAEREQERAEQRQRDEAKHELEQRERDQIAASIDFLAGLSPATAGLVRSITAVTLDEDSDYPPGLSVAADGGRMKCTQWEIVDGLMTGEIRYFDTTFLHVLQFAVEHHVIDLDLKGLNSQQAVELLIANEVWPAARRLFDDRDENDPVWINGSAYHLVDDNLVEVHDDYGVVVWAELGDAIQLGTLGDFESLAESARQTNRALAANTWEELVDVFGRNGVQYEFSDLLDQAWEEWSIEHGTDDERPDEWFPDKLPDLTGDWLLCRPRYTDPEQLDLPDEIMDLGRFESNMMSGNFVDWNRSDLPKLERLANRLGYEFVERQDLIDWI